MQKSPTTYTVSVLTDTTNTIGAQILFYAANNVFCGRIDFYKTGSTIPVSYLWHPTSLTDPSQTYLVLALPMLQFDGVASLLRNEGPWIMELWPKTSPMVGASTDGYSGSIRTSTNEPIGEEERSFQSGH